MPRSVRPRRRAGRCAGVVPCLAVAAALTACTSDPVREAPIDAFPQGSPSTATEPTADPSSFAGTTFEVPDVTIEVPGLDPPGPVRVRREVSARDRDLANFLLQEQLLRVRLDASGEEPGTFSLEAPDTELPDRLVLDRWLGGPDGYLVCLYDNETGLWALGTGYVRGGTSVADVEVGDDFARRCA